MAKAPQPAAENPEEFTDLQRSTPAQSAAGLPAVTSSMKHALRESGAGRALKSWLGLNQKDGTVLLSHVLHVFTGYAVLLLMAANAGAGVLNHRRARSSLNGPAGARRPE